MVNKKPQHSNKLWLGSGERTLKERTKANLSAERHASDLCSHEQFQCPVMKALLSVELEAATLTNLYQIQVGEARRQALQETHPHHNLSVVLKELCELGCLLSLWLVHSVWLSLGTAYRKSKSVETEAHSSINPSHTCTDRGPLCCQEGLWSVESVLLKAAPWNGQLPPEETFHT